MYKLCVDESRNNKVSCILRIADNVLIPLSEANTDYAAYLKWLEAGNTPQPADEVTK